jgi:hypothetical protein
MVIRLSSDVGDEVGEEYDLVALVQSIDSHEGYDGHDSDGTKSINSTSNVLDVRTRPGLHRNVTVFEPWVESESSDVLNIPKRVFRWIYSISLVIFVFITLLFVAVTIVDVIAQTSKTSFSGIKLFIVIIVCVVFAIVSLILYFLRILQTRIALNDIPGKSVYIPFEGDYPHDVFTCIDEKLRQCHEIGIKAGPLSDPSIIINHPGLSPPEYIQDRNRKFTEHGTMMPADLAYEEIIRSIGDKFLADKHNVFSPVDLPIQLSFREILIYLSKIFIDSSQVEKDKLPDVQRMIDLYEQFRFGPNLIREKDLVEFMVHFEKLLQLCQVNYQRNVSALMQTSRASMQSFGDYDPGYSNKPTFGYYSYSSESSTGSDVSSNSSFVHFHHEQVNLRNFEKISDGEESSSEAETTSDEDDGSVINLRTKKGFRSQHTLHSVSTTGSRVPPDRYARSSISGNSVKSVLKMKLALGPQKTNSFEELDRQYSGYLSDLDRGYLNEDNNDEFDQDNFGIYKFRKRPT